MSLSYDRGLPKWKFKTKKQLPKDKLQNDIKNICQCLFSAYAGFGCPINILCNNTVKDSQDDAVDTLLDGSECCAHVVDAVGEGKK